MKRRRLPDSKPPPEKVTLRLALGFLALLLVLSLILLIVALVTGQL